MVGMADDGLGYRIGQRRAALGLTQADLVRRLHLSPATISYWETGATKSIRLDRFFDLADVLECSPRWLATGEGVPDPELCTHEDRALYDVVRSLDPAKK